MSPHPLGKVCRCRAVQKCTNRVGGPECRIQDLLKRRRAMPALYPPPSTYRGALSTYLSIHLFVSLSLSLATLSIYLSIYLSNAIYIHVSNYFLSLYLFIWLSFWYHTLHNYTITQLHDTGLCRPGFSLQCNYVLVRYYTLHILHDYSVA